MRLKLGNKSDLAASLDGSLSEQVSSPANRTEHVIGNGSGFIEDNNVTQSPPKTDSVVSETPLTDAAELVRSNPGMVLADFARQLERELNEATQERDSLREQLKQARDNALEEAAVLAEEHARSYGAINDAVGTEARIRDYAAERALRTFSEQIRALKSSTE